MSRFWDGFEKHARSQRSKSQSDYARLSKKLSDEDDNKLHFAAAFGSDRSAHFDHSEENQAAHMLRQIEAGKGDLGSVMKSHKQKVTNWINSYNHLPHGAGFNGGDTDFMNHDIVTDHY